MVTAGTYKKEHLFRGPKRLDVLHRGLLAVAQEFGWQLEAWAVFSNHYHFVGHSPAECDDAETLSAMLSKLMKKLPSGLMVLTKRMGDRFGTISGKRN
jgi:REP-associated tyrosine transposase